MCTMYNVHILSLPFSVGIFCPAWFRLTTEWEQTKSHRKLFIWMSIFNFGKWVAVNGWEEILIGWPCESLNSIRFFSTICWCYSWNECAYVTFCVLNVAGWFPSFLPFIAFSTVKCWCSVECVWNLNMSFILFSCVSGYLTTMKMLITPTDGCACMWCEQMPNVIHAWNEEENKRTNNEIVSKRLYILLSIPLSWVSFYCCSRIDAVRVCTECRT